MPTRSWFVRRVVIALIAILSGCASNWADSRDIDEDVLYPWGTTREDLETKYGAGRVGYIVNEGPRDEVAAATGEGGEALRLSATHPAFEVVYAAGESSAGQRLVERFPGLPGKLGELAIEKWDPGALPELEVLFASLPTGQSTAALARVPAKTKIIDI